MWPIICQILLATGECLTLTPSQGVIPREYPDKLYSPEARMIVLPDAENHTIRQDTIPEREGMTDRRTDAQTDRIAIASTRSELRAMRTRCKNAEI